MTRFLIAMTVAGAVAGGFSGSAFAAQGAIAPAGVANATMMANVIQVDRRCGRHRHFVGPHRWHGRMVRGYCTWDHGHHRAGH